MKQLIITGFIALTTLSSCEWFGLEELPTHEEIMYQMAQDTLASIDDLYALCIYYGDDEVGFYWNSSDYYCNNPDGSCDTTLVFTDPDSLRIEYSISFIGGFHTGVTQDYIHRMTVYVPYEIMDSITKTAPNEWYRGREIMAVYVNEYLDNRVHDEETIIIPSAAKSTNTPRLPRRRQGGEWAGWD